MNINQVKQSAKNEKSQKSYNVKFKKRIVGYYRMGVYDEQTIEKKFKINRTLLWKWNKWYYDHFLADYYSKPNYGKGKSLQEENQKLKQEMAQLKKSLKKEQMKSRGMEILLEIAETDHQLKLKKNGKKV